MAAQPKIKNEMQLITFQLGKNQYAIDIKHVQEIIRILEITRVPKAPDYIAGVINLRGTVITVVNLHQRFGLEPQPITDDSRIIIIKWEKVTAGIMVDNASEVTKVSRDSIEAPVDVGARQDKDYIQGLVKGPQHLFILLDPAKLLASKEDNHNG